MASILTGCNLVHRMDIEQGNVLTPDRINRLHVGMSKAQVKEIMGTPMVTNTFSDDRMEYVYTFKPGNGCMCEKYLLLFFNQNGVLTHFQGK